MKVNKTLELFYKFLEENNVLIAWENAYADDQALAGTNRPRAEYFHRNLDLPLCWISSAFVWHRTPQGGVYWARLSHAWETYFTDNS